MSKIQYKEQCKITM